jgi:lipopolysaccharide transport system permease protein
MDITSRKSADTLEPTADSNAMRVTPTMRAAAREDNPLELPITPLVTIQPSQSWAPLNLRDLWNYRGLFYFLMWRDLKVRYKQTIFGIAWVVMQPLLMTLIFTIFLGMLARVPSDNVPYPLLAYTGLMMWTFFAGAVVMTSNSLVGNAHLITKVYFPRLLIPTATIGARLVDFGIGFIILVGMLIYYRVGLTWNMLMIPFLVLLVTLLALGLGMWTSALNVKYRDIAIALPVLIQLWMFASPVVYSSALVPPTWRWVYELNPLAGIIEGFRASLFGQSFNWRAIGISSAITLLLLIYAAYAFRGREKTFADLI